jgi:membrane dipeptidase
MATSKPVKAVDAHSDYPLEIMRQRRKLQRKVFETQHLPELRKGGVIMEVSTVGGDFVMDSDGALFDVSDPRIVLETIDAMHQELTESPDVFGLVLDASDIDRIIGEGKIAILFNLEGVKCVEDDFSLFRNYYRLGIRALSLTHNPRNLMADGCREGRKSGGLSNLGKRFVKELNNYNVIVDLVHINEQGFFDVLDVYDGPVVVSHSNADAVLEHGRNLSDAQIKAVAERGGTIGINFVGLFSHKEPDQSTVSDLIDHIDYMVELGGIECVGIGPDYFNYFLEMVLGLLSREGLPQSLLSMTQGLEDVSKLQYMAESLSERGYSDEHVRMIMGENFIRAYKAILGRDLPEEAKRSIDRYALREVHA